METKFLIIGVGSAGCKVADNIDIPNSKKLFIDEEGQTLLELKSKGLIIDMDYLPYWPSKHSCPRIGMEKALYHKDLIRECIKEAFEVKNE